ncbi:MAG: hypothetical protein J5932_08345 [Prevotella sp.]|nr:hypothetical protein [Prevotella sp.]MBP3218903.1 hypothetical protein [Prevotella sp.]
MDNEYTFKDFLAALKKWQSGNLVEYYRFLGILGQEELDIMNLFFALVKQMSFRVPRLVVEDDVRIPQEMADIIKRSHTIERMINAMGYIDLEPFLMSLLYWIYFDHSYEWIYSKIKDPIPGYKLGLLKYPLSYIANRYVVKKSLELGIRTQADWKRFWNLNTEMKTLPYNEVFELLPNELLFLEDGKADGVEKLPEPITLPNKVYKPLSEIINVPDSKSKEKLLNNIHELLKKRSTGNDLVLLLVALKNIRFAPEKSPVISNKLYMTEYRESLVLEFTDLDFVKVRNIQYYFSTLYHKDAKGKLVIENSWYKQELQYLTDELLK